jgi:hypothetical protein
MAKVKELKAINIPAKTTYANNYSKNYGGYYSNKGTNSNKNFTSASKSNTYPFGYREELTELNSDIPSYDMEQEIQEHFNQVDMENSQHARF